MSAFGGKADISWLRFELDTGQRAPVALSIKIQMTRRSFDLGQPTFLQGSLDQNRPG
jgi:hypothetical protein